MITLLCGQLGSLNRSMNVNVVGMWIKENAFLCNFEHDNNCITLDKSKQILRIQISEVSSYEG